MTKGREAVRGVKERGRNGSAPVLAGARSKGHRGRPWEAVFGLLILVLQAACVSGPVGRGLLPAASVREAPDRNEHEVREFDVGFLEPEPGTTRPVRVPKADFQRALSRLARSAPVQGPAREVARRLLETVEQAPPEEETVELSGHWVLEMDRHRTYTLLPESQTGPVALEPVADAALKRDYLAWCEGQGGGDCRGLLEDGPYLTAEDRRVLALSLALGGVLEETQAALGRQVNARALASLVAWTLGTYLMLWLLPEPVSKGVAATLTVVLVAWLGLDTLWGLMDGWSALVSRAYEASTFAELRAAGEEFGRLLGEDAARAMVMAVVTVAGRTVGEVAAAVKELPGVGAAGVQWRAQGGEAVLLSAAEWAPAVAEQGAVVVAVRAVETVALAPQGALAVVMLKQGPGAGGGGRGGRTSRTVLRHRGGNRQEELSTGARWHLPRGKSVADIPKQDPVGDQLQAAVTRAASEWRPGLLSNGENAAIRNALRKGRYWLARLLEREARGRFVHETVKAEFESRYLFSRQGVDVIDPTTGLQYEILSGTASNLARHGRRMANEFFRMLTF